MRAARLIALFALILHGYTTGVNGENWENQAVLSTGQQVILAWFYEPLSPDASLTIDSFIVYRQAGSQGSVSAIAQISSAVREYTFTMPGGKNAEYRIRIAAVASDGTISPTTNEFLITRKK